MLRQILAIGICLVASLTAIQAYTSCIPVATVQTDSAWFIENAADGFDMVEHSDCNNCEDQEAWKWTHGQGRTLAKKLCFIMRVTTKWSKETYKLPFDCKYYGDNISNQTCSLDFSKTDLKDRMPLRGGNIFFTHTDNATYVAGTVCISEYDKKLKKNVDRENFYWIMKTTTGTPEDGVLKTVRQEFISLGFKDKIAVVNKSPLFVHKLTAHPSNC